MTPPDSEGTIIWRVGNVEQQLRDEQQARREADRELDKTKADEKDVARIGEELAGLRRALIVFSLSLCSLSVTIIIGLLAVAG